jgi:hypothetical protein
MKRSKAINKRFASKGDRLNWSALNGVETFKLTRDVIVGKIVSKSELLKRSNLDALNANVLIN